MPIGTDVGRRVRRDFFELHGHTALLVSLGVRRAGFSHRMEALDQPPMPLPGSRCPRALSAVVVLYCLRSSTAEQCTAKPKARGIGWSRLSWQALHVAHL